MSNELNKALDALEFAEGAIVDAITLEDGLDVTTGLEVLKRVGTVLVDAGRTSSYVTPAQQWDEYRRIEAEQIEEEIK